MTKKPYATIISLSGGATKELTKKQYEAMKKAEFMEWLKKKPWPEVSIENDNPIAEFVWCWLLEFRDKTEEGSKYGYYFASRNKVVAEAIEDLQKLVADLNQSKPKQLRKKKV